GFRLEHHPRGFFYFQGELKGELPKSVRQMALFVYILIEHLGEQARDLEAEFFDTEFTLEGLPHAKKDRYVELLEDLDVPATLDGLRSEEHTSELQSRENLVCRLLHEKKNEQQQYRIYQTQDT